MNKPQITILGVGSILMTDEGFGVRVIEELARRYLFPENVKVIDGGVLGLNLLGVMADADHLIVIDAIRNRGSAGDLYRFTKETIPERIRAKNSLHQIDFLESLTLCQAVGNVPETVILGVEPLDIDTLGLELTPLIRERVEPVIGMVLGELDRLGVSYREREDNGAEPTAD